MGRKTQHADGSGGRRSKLAAKGKLREQLIEELLAQCTHCDTASLEEHQSLFELVKRIIDVEKDSTPALPSRSENFPAFIEWCETNALDMSKVDIVPVNEDKSEYGLRAKVDIEANSTVLEISREVMMTTESALRDEHFANFVKEDRIVETMSNVLLALHLISEFDKKDSFWKPYINILPSTYQTPLYLSTAELRTLKPSPWLDDSIKMCRSIGRQYAYFWKQMHLTKSAASQLPFKNIFTYELYRWAVSAIMTRQNFVPASDGNGMLNALIPLWDLCNHVNGKYSTDFDLEKNSAVCYAMKDFPIGSEITIFYGNRSNGEFFVHSGFVYDENAHDFLPVKLGISKNDKLVAQKSALCAKLGLSAPGTYQLHAAGNLSASLLAFLRVFNFNEEQVSAWLGREDLSPLTTKNTEDALLLDVDKKARQFLEARAALLLRAYPEEINDPQGYNGTMIARLLNCERCILKSHINNVSS